MPTTPLSRRASRAIIAFSFPTPPPRLPPAAKNVILAGVHSVTVHDTVNVELADLGAQFYLAEGDVGQNRAEACRERLHELNTTVVVNSATGPLTEDFLSQFQVRGGRFNALRQALSKLALASMALQR